MIIFKKVRWKNFLSTGDRYTEVVLDNPKSTLIIGQNGAGKSTMLDAVSVALFGKAHRSISKPQLVNSINGKHCLVEVEFDIGKSEFNTLAESLSFLNKKTSTNLINGNFSKNLKRKFLIFKIIKNLFL